MFEMGFSDLQSSSSVQQSSNEVKCKPGRDTGKRACTQHSSIVSEAAHVLFMLSTGNRLVMKEKEEKIENSDSAFALKMSSLSP